MNFVSKLRLSKLFQDESLDSYIDTIIAGVADIFKHPSVGARLGVQVVKKVFLDHEENNGCVSLHPCSAIFENYLIIDW